ncbi:MAG: UDP-N-acetylglucosamine--N-acetylmuramyl-(pentapeptide) pyrophosphoryl-undecaprenol N-acetylglucosamine transferase [Halioglobus sp.]|jgi:UDP-N-acetylglucosamine--N-acetylmuramyl-(pentapeptide) pyrophosphoryl-undecaprenol N-acetylglucosamine transferase
MTALNSPLVLMMAGGTGGHVYPALAVAKELLSRGFRVEWVGTDRGLEARVVPEAGITLHHLVVRGLRGKNVIARVAGLFYVLLSTLQALRLLLRLSPNCVVGMGGYASGPAGLAAWILRKPLLIHEQNAVAGTTNRLLAPLASTVLAGFPGAFKADSESKVVGNPVRRELLERAAASPYQFDGSRPLRLLVVGGSLGAQPINDVVPVAIRELEAAHGADKVEILHQSGAKHLEALLQSYGSLVGASVRVNGFIEDMAEAYAWSDVVLCRAGALTVSELAIMGRPAILVPLPHAIDDHQSANARFLVAPGGGVLLPQSELTASSLLAVLESFLNHPERLCAMAAASAELAVPEATAAVSDYCEGLMNAQ